jgi:hypothetical protein
MASAGEHGWADLVAVFHKPGPHPLIRKGRIFDHTVATDTYDGANGAELVLQNERSTTFETAAAADARVRLKATEAEARRIRGVFSALQEQVAALKEERAAPETAVRDRGF